MKQALRIVGVCLAVLFIVSAPAMAQEGAKDPLINFKGAGAIGAALVVIGGGAAIGKIGVAALESMARQPEVADKVQLTMIIAAALVEGATLFAIVVCLMGL